MNTNLYEHRQPAIFIIRLFLGIAITILLLATVNVMNMDGSTIEAISPLSFFLIPPSILLIVGTLFRSLTVCVGKEDISLAFGLGIIRKRFRIEDIESSRVVRNRWYYGLGIRKIQNGWLYNVSGLDAVELQMKDGRRFRIGTDEPDELLEAIEVARR
ncbi:MAG: hypothetical protein VCC01_11215 [Candidatus Hydrogenedentota bacterium]